MPDLQDTEHPGGMDGIRNNQLNGWICPHIIFESSAYSLGFAI